MSATSGHTTSKFIGGCPYVGMLSDPQTHVGLPDERNYCHLIQPPRQVTIASQQALCLGGGFPDCPVYKSSGEGPVPAEIFEGGATGGGIFPGLRFPRRKQSAKLLINNNEKELVLAASVATASMDQGDLPVDDQEDTDYQFDADRTELRKRSLRLGAMILILLVGAIAAWWGVSLLRGFAQSGNGAPTSNPSLAIAIQEKSTAEFAWATAADILEVQNLTATASAGFSSLVIAQPTKEPTRSSTATYTAAPPTPTTTPAACDNVDLTRLELISGPQLSPPLGTLYLQANPKPQAVWVVRNAGSCTWNEVLLWSVKDNKVVQPNVLWNGQPFLGNNNDVEAGINPGESIEIALEFNPFNTIKVDGEWVLVINGLSLFGQPRIELTVANWLIFPKAATPTPTTKVRTPKPGGNPTDETPPPRP